MLAEEREEEVREREARGDFVCRAQRRRSVRRSFFRRGEATTVPRVRGTEEATEGLRLAAGRQLTRLDCLLQPRPAGRGGEGRRLEEPCRARPEGGEGEEGEGRDRLIAEEAERIDFFGFGEKPGEEAVVVVFGPGK
jgi:hypothetical protein